MHMKICTIICALCMFDNVLLLNVNSIIILMVTYYCVELLCALVHCISHSIPVLIIRFVNTFLFKHYVSLCIKCINWLNHIFVC